MEVFISWSGKRSHAVAIALRGWLPKIINALEPWLSSADIDKGARWGADVASRLSAAKAGIICLTPSNLQAPWINFEAGAISKTVENTFVCTLLVGLDPSDVQGPLAQFQATKPIKDDMLKLLKTLNRAPGEKSLPETQLEETFEMLWPNLEAQLLKLPPDEPSSNPRREEREILEEILQLVRNQNRSNRISSNELRRLRHLARRDVMRTAIGTIRPIADSQADITWTEDDDLYLITAKTKDGKVRTFTLPKELAPGDVEQALAVQMLRDRVAQEVKNTESEDPD